MANQPGPGQKAEDKDPKLAKPVQADPMCALAAAHGGGGGGVPPVFRVQLDHAVTGPPSDQRFLWTKIREGTRRIAFPAYEQFITRLFCVTPEPPNTPLPLKGIRERVFVLGDHVAGVNAYQTLKAATEAFLLLSCGVLPRDPAEFFGAPLLPADANAELREQHLAEENVRLGESLTIPQILQGLRRYLGPKLDGLETLPYFRTVLEGSFSRAELGTRNPVCEGILNPRIDAHRAPCFLELIWSYWHEEAGLVQAINMVALRFQNRLDPSGQNPLSQLNLDPLRGLSNLLWGYIQDDLNRLTLQRRSYEYDHHYGLTLYGKAVQPLRPADSRSKFIEALHNLLARSTAFYRQDDDTTVRADGFPVLQGLKEVHLLLAEGAHNQFGDLPWTARVEMLLQQWLLARPEMSQFLNSRPMVPYTEGWMAQTDTLKKVFGWHDTSVTHFNHLALFGEQLFLAARYGNWLDVNDPALAAEWARYWRPEVQSYIHAYRAVTGVDLTLEPVDTRMPSRLLRDRLPMTGGGASLAL